MQGLGASILAPSVLAIISATFPERSERTRALAWYSVVAGAGASLGMVLGGVFAGLLSWRIGFLVNIPIGIGLLFVVNAAEAGWLDAVTVATLVSSVVVLGLFIRHEGRVAVPILPLRLFRSRERCAAYLARMLYVGSIVSFFFFGTQYMQRVLGYSALQAGLGFLPMTLVQFAAALAVPRLDRALGGAPMLIGSLLLISMGLLWLSRAGVDASAWQLALPMVLIGIGNGGAMAPLTSSGVRDVDAGDQDAASGIVNVAHQLGGSLGLSSLIVVFTASADPLLAAAQEMSRQLSAVFTGAAVFNVLALALTALFILPAHRHRLDDQATRRCDVISLK